MLAHGFETHRSSHVCAVHEARIVRARCCPDSSKPLGRQSLTLTHRPTTIDDSTRRIGRPPWGECPAQAAGFTRSLGGLYLELTEFSLTFARISIGFSATVSAALAEVSRGKNHGKSPQPMARPASSRWHRLVRTRLRPIPLPGMAPKTPATGHRSRPRFHALWSLR